MARASAGDARPAGPGLSAGGTSVAGTLPRELPRGAEEPGLGGGVSKPNRGFVGLDHKVHWGCGPSR